MFGELETVKKFFDVLPKVTDALMQCNSIVREHQEKPAMKYSDQEYLKAVNRLYKEGRINGEQAIKAMEMIYGGNQSIIKSIPLNNSY